MRKKVLILSGSPRKGGNSDILCDEWSKPKSCYNKQLIKSIPAGNAAFII